MVTQYDSSGKIFTKRVRKDNISARIQTLTHQIVGEVYVAQNMRLKDELVREAFLAVTNARVYSPKGSLLYEAPFMAVNRDHLIWVIPEEPDEPDDNDNDLAFLEPAEPAA